MTGYDANEFVSVPLPTMLYQAVAARHPTSVSAVIEHVVWDFLDRTAGDARRANAAASLGVAWGPASLPEGTELRTRYFQEYLHAVVRGGRVVTESGEFGSVAQAANALRGGTSNNAWMVMEVKRPGESRWMPASELRT